MQKNTVKDFFNKATNDSALLGQLKAAEDLEEIIRLAAQSGFRFTMQELQAAATPVRFEVGLPESKLTPPSATLMACSQSGCDYKSYVSRCNTLAHVQSPD